MFHTAFRCRCNRADVLYRNYLKYYFHVRTDAWYWYACGQLNCCHRKYLSSARRRLFHPESSGRRIKTGDGAIIASTLTTISVYAPIIFTEGITRQLFVDLALTIAYTLVASLVVALTFVPAMASVTLRKTKDIRHPWFDAAREWYGRVLEWCLRFKPLVLIIAVVLLIGSAALSLSKGLNFMDMDMETNQLSVTISAKEGEKLTLRN